MTTYDVGDMVTITAEFTDLAGVPADPGTVTLQIREPDGTVTAYAEVDMAHPAPGTWSMEVPLDAGGWWHYRFAGVGGLVAAGEGRIQVAASVFA